ncbi:MAG: hypothetical protein HY015_02855 [Bacteroidetes bacterium]|nr:hypothetical protein [Bacteroidota bacterium]MBI3481909.1 hypothetical protein [Bacteroidota bacterium]
MKKSNVSFENLLDQLSEEKINRVVDRDALRAGGLDLLLGGGGCASSTGSKHTDTHSSTTSSANCNCGGGGLFGL